VLGQVIHKMQFSLNLFGSPVGAEGDPQDAEPSIMLVFVNKVSTAFKTGEQFQGILLYTEQPRGCVENFSVANAYYLFSLQVVSRIF